MLFLLKNSSIRKSKKLLQNEINSKDLSFQKLKKKKEDKSFETPNLYLHLYFGLFSQWKDRV